MVEPHGEKTFSFSSEGQLPQKRLAALLAAFHRNAMQFSATYRSIIDAIPETAVIDVHIGEDHESGVIKLFRKLDSESGIHHMRIDMYHDGIEKLVYEDLESVRQGDTLVLATVTLLFGVIEVSKSFKRENPHEAAGRPQPENETFATGIHGSIPQGMSDNHADLWTKWVGSLKGIPEDFVDRIYREISDNRALS